MELEDAMTTQSKSIIDKLNEEFIEPYLQVSIHDFDLIDSERVSEALLAFCEKHFNPFSAIRGKSMDLTLMDGMIQKKTTLAEYLIKYSRDELKYETGKNLLGFSDSYCRMYLLLQLYDHMNHDDWFKLFFENWESCDGCSIYSNELIDIFEEHDLEDLRQTYFSPEQKATYDALPDQITIYRGSLHSPASNVGLSWTTDREVAEKFAYSALSLIQGRGMMFRMAINMLASEFKKIADVNAEEACILKLIVNKKDVLIFNGRGEDEIFLPTRHSFENMHVEEILN